MLQTDINFFAVVLSMVWAMVVGFAWYGPIFGKPWMNLVGMTEKDMEESRTKGMNLTYLMMTVIALVMAYVLAILLNTLDVLSITQGVVIALWIWFGFIATNLYNGVLFNKKPVRLFAIEAGYQLVSIVGMAVILVLLR